MHLVWYLVFLVEDAFLYEKRKVLLEIMHWVVKEWVGTCQVSVFHAFTIELVLMTGSLLLETRQIYTYPLISKTPKSY